MSWASRVTTLTALIMATAVLAGCASSGGGSGRYSQRSDAYPTKDVPALDNIPDAVPRVEPLAASGNRPKYQVLGKTYYVMKNPKGYSATGVASFYGTKFHGYSTSSGERYNMYGMTAASKNLPLPTYVRVTNLANNRSVIVKVNDRGPFNDRLIDLSYAAAYKLGYLAQGTANVRVEAIDPATWNPSSSVARQPAPAPVTTSRIAPMAQEDYASRSAGSAVGSYLQVTAVSNAASAEQLRQRLASALGVGGRVEQHGNMYRVQMGPYNSSVALAQGRTQLTGLGYPNSITVN